MAQLDQNVVLEILQSSNLREPLLQGNTHQWSQSSSFKASSTGSVDSSGGRGSSSSGGNGSGTGSGSGDHSSGGGISGSGGGVSGSGGGGSAGGGDDGGAASGSGSGGGGSGTGGSGGGSGGDASNGGDGIAGSGNGGSGVVSGSGGGGDSCNGGGAGSGSGGSGSISGGGGDASSGGDGVASSGSGVVSSSGGGGDHPSLCHLYASPLVKDVEGGLEPVDKLQYEIERRQLQTVLAHSNRALEFRSEVATPKAFLRNLTRCAVLHFTGHGEPGALTLEDEVGKQQLVEERKLRQWVSGKDSIPRLVFISACYSETVASGFLSAGVPHVVAVCKDHTVKDREAVSFMNAFYEMLLSGDSVRQAFNKARDVLGLAAESHQEAAKFRLLPEDAAHDERPMRGVSIGPYTDATRPPAPSTMVAAAGYFSGREINVQALVDAVQRQVARAVCVAGPSGVGKTQVVAKACEYLCERHLVGQVLHIPLGRQVTAAPPDLPPSDPGPAAIAAALNFPLPPPPFNIEEALVEGVVLKLGAGLAPGTGSGRPVLLVLDGCSPWLVRGALTLRAFVDRLLEVPALRRLCVVTTCIRPVGAQGERVINLEPLDDVRAAEVFCKAAPRAYSPAELMDGHGTMVADLNLVFSRGQIVSLLKGNPGAIVAVTQSLHERNLLRDASFIRARLIPEKLATLAARDSKFKLELDDAHPPPPDADPPPPNPPLVVNTRLPPPPADVRKLHGQQVWASVRRRASTVAVNGAVVNAWQNGSPSSTSSSSSSSWAPTWGQLCELGIVDYFRLRLGTSRPPTPEDLAFLGKSGKIWDPFAAPRAPHAVVQHAAFFESFWPWLWAAVRLLRASGLWCPSEGVGSPGRDVPALPRFILGLPDGLADRVLYGSVPGTFLFRISTSMLSTLVICHVRSDGKVSNTPIKYVCDYDASDASGVYRVQVNAGFRTYNTLQDLVIDQSSLMALYPNEPKHAAMQRLTSSSGHTSSSGDTPRVAQPAPPLTLPLQVALPRRQSLVTACDSAADDPS